MNLRILFPALLLSLTSLHAGSFGGPGPFRNGSPLPSGTDGTYQGVATATNVTGLFTFQISNGVQTTTPTNNTWVFFVDGNVLTGGTQANISEGQVAGVLDPAVSTSLGGEDNTLSGSVAFIVPGNSASGEFRGNIDLNSPVASFSGSGTLSGTPARTDQLVYIWDLSNFSSITFGSSTFSPVFVEPIAIPGSSFPTTNFKFRGTRLNTSGSSTTSTTTTTSN